MKAGLILGPFFYSTRGIWGNLLCDGWFKYRGTRSTEVRMCMGLSRNRNHDLTVLGKSFIGGSRVSFLQRWPKILLPILWWPTVIRIDVVFWLGIVVLDVIVASGP
jgi:hypothetical protein